MKSITTSFTQQYKRKVKLLSQQGNGKKKSKTIRTSRKNTKKTSIGRRPKMSSMNKAKKRSFKAYNKQGK